MSKKCKFCDNRTGRLVGIPPEEAKKIPVCDTCFLAGKHEEFFQEEALKVAAPPPKPKSGSKKATKPKPKPEPKPE